MYLYDLRWKKNKTWWYYDEYLIPRLTKDAPKEAVESYNNYLNQLRKRNKRKNKPNSG